MENIWSKKWVILGSALVILLVGGCSIRTFFVTLVDSYELGYSFDKTTGRITVLEHTGWAWVKPFITEVHTVDLRPMQVRIEANDRILNAMLVRFKPAGLEQFLELHGRKDYTQAVLSDILKSYAYEGMGSGAYSQQKLQEKYLFLEIMGGTGGSAGGQSQNSQDNE